LAVEPLSSNPVTFLFPLRFVIFPWTMTTVRKSLHPLQHAAGDKENLVGPGRMIHADKDNLKSLRYGEKFLHISNVIFTELRRQFGLIVCLFCAEKPTKMKRFQLQSLIQKHRATSGRKLLASPSKLVVLNQSSQRRT